MERFGVFRILGPLGAGGMAETVVAQREGSTQRVCLKRMHAGLERQPSLARQFEEEARVASQLDHPNLVRVLDYGRHAGRLYIETELVEGTDLQSLLERRRAERAPLSADATAHLGISLAAGLGQAHALGIHHRDVAPANVLLATDGTVKLADFGIAKAADGTQLTVTGTVKGKPAYMAPEYAVHGDATPASDLFSIGVVLFECVALRRPYFGATDIENVRLMQAGKHGSLSKLAPHAPAPLAAIIERLLRPRPSERFANAEELRKALEGLDVSLEAGRTDLASATSALRRDLPAALARDRRGGRIGKAAVLLGAGCGLLGALGIVGVVLAGLIADGYSDPPRGTGTQETDGGPRSVHGQWRLSYPQLSRLDYALDEEPELELPDGTSGHAIRWAHRDMSIGAVAPYLDVYLLTTEEENACGRVHRWVASLIDRDGFHQSMAYVYRDGSWRGSSGLRSLQSAADADGCEVGVALLGPDGLELWHLWGDQRTMRERVLALHAHGEHADVWWPVVWSAEVRGLSIGFRQGDPNLPVLGLSGGTPLARDPRPPLDPAEALPDPPDGVETVTYESRGVELPAFINDPAGGAEGRRPAVLWLHDRLGDVGADCWDGPATRLVAEGLVVMCPAFRGENGQPGQAGFFDNHVRDASSALTLLRRRMNVDPEHVYVVGEGTGATIAVLLATRTDDATAVYASRPLAQLFDRSVPGLATDQPVLTFERRDFAAGVTRSPLYLTHELEVRVQWSFSNDERGRRLITALNTVGGGSAVLASRGSSNIGEIASRIRSEATGR